MNISIEDLPREINPGYLLGTAVINGGYFHIECFRVQVDSEGMMSAVEGDDPDNEERLDALVSVCGGAPETIKIEGRPGDWAVSITPHC